MMATLTKTKDFVDIESWEAGRVPNHVLQLMTFVYMSRATMRRGPSWLAVAQFMGWADLPRSEWRSKMKKYRRWGLRWIPNVEHSTRVHRDVRPLLEKRIRESK